MDIISPFLTPPQGQRPRLAIFLSGSGSNAEQVLERARTTGDVPFETAILVTDAPETSRARELGRIFGLPVLEEDIHAFYRANGETRVSIATARGQALRKAWTDRLRQRLAAYHVDFAVFAGFVPLTNITADFPCLNVHPGDLTYRKNGRRHLVGLHTTPIERAILEGLDELRSSVIVALPYTGTGDDMDNGPVLGISGPVPVDFAGMELAALRHDAEARPRQRPTGGYRDRLETIAKVNQESLKRRGDWVVLPAVVFDFARGLFGKNRTGRLHYRLAERWHPVETVVYEKNGQEVIFAPSP